MKYTRTAHHPDDLEDIGNRIAEIKSKHLPLDITVTRHVPPHSRSQRAYLEATIRGFAIEKGYSNAAEVECVREVVLYDLMPLVELDIGGKKRMVRQSTRALTHEQMSALIEKLIAYLATEHNYAAPPA